MRTLLDESEREVFRRWEEEEIPELDELDARSGAARRELHERQALLLPRAAADTELGELTSSGPLPERLRHRASAARGATRGRC